MLALQPDRLIEILLLRQQQQQQQLQEQAVLRALLQKQAAPQSVDGGTLLAMIGLQELLKTTAFICFEYDEIASYS